MNRMIYMFDTLGGIKVYTVIRNRYLPNNMTKNTVQEHKHDYYQLVYALNDYGAMVVNGNVIKMSKGEVLIIPRNEMHTFFVEDGIFETYELKFVFLDEESDKLREKGMFRCNDYDGGIRKTLRDIEREIIYTDEYSKSMVAIEVCKIILLMMRKDSSEQSIRKTSEIPVENPVNDEQYNKVMQFIEDNLSRDITVKDISDAVCAEYKYFSHCFVLKYGIRLKQYIKGRRIEKAKEMLTQTDKNMSEIAESCGFGSIHYLARVFKKEESMSPTEFRKRFKNIYSVLFVKEPESYDSSDKNLQ